MIHAQREEFDDRDPFLLCLLGVASFARRLGVATAEAGPARGEPACSSGDDARLLDALVGVYAMALSGGREIAEWMRAAAPRPERAGTPSLAAVPRRRGSLLA